MTQPVDFRARVGGSPYDTYPEPIYTRTLPEQPPKEFRRKPEDNTGIWDTLATMAVPGYGAAKLARQVEESNPGFFDASARLLSPAYGAVRTAQDVEKANPGFFDKAMCLTNPAYAMVRGVQSAFSNN